MITWNDLISKTDYLWEIPRSFRQEMRVGARIYASESMIRSILRERALEQLVNVATLPGIRQAAFAMPDIHEGYGFPIGGVAGIRARDGVISPGGVGYDINCGVRLLRTEYALEELEERIIDLANQMQRDIPSGVGRGGKIILGDRDLEKVLNNGVEWAVQKEFAFPEDRELIEEKGSYLMADSVCVSDRAKRRGKDQLGTLGAGNHFVEIQEVVEIFDSKIAKAFGLKENQLCVMIHTGSRGLGHQVCTDYVRLMNRAIIKYKIDLPDRELSCAPFFSPEGQRYFKAMSAAANYAWVNRQLITHYVRRAWNHVLSGKENKLSLIYDVAHNMAKLETHKGRQYIVHRKGATRAFGPGHTDLPKAYQSVGQPVLIPGSMGTASYVLSGTEQAMRLTFGSTCHGAGRVMSRSQAKKTIDYQTMKQDLDEKGIVVRTGGSKKSLLEEAPAVYKQIESVVKVVCQAQIARKVAKLRPLAVIKG